MNLLSYLDELGIDSDMSVTPGSEEPGHSTPLKQLPSNSSRDEYQS